MNRLKELRKSKGYTLEKLSKLINVAPNTLSQYELERREAPYETIKKLASIFNVSIDYLLNNEERPTKKGVRIPVLGTIPAGIPIEAIEDVLDWEEIDEDMASRGEYFALKVKGTSMTPEITDGEIAIVKVQEDAESGSICVVMVNGNDATLKRIKKSTQGITLVPTNTIDFEPTFYTNEEIESLPIRILGKVVETRKTW